MGVSDSEILEQLEALISDLSHVVSYKWLSRKYSVSSNAAKRLLHEFVDKHRPGVEVLYVLSGWTNEKPPSYSVRLVKGSQLEDAKALLVEGFSTHVYSVQASLPRDPAQLWSHDYVQAEEFYNEPLEAVNCLRDNRFSGVICSAVNRDTKARGYCNPPLTSSEQVTPSKLPDQSGKKPGEPVNLPAPDVKNDGVTSSRAANSGKAKPAHVVSLANMWGRSASSTSPPKATSISPEKKQAVPGNAEPGQEEEAGASSDDDLTKFVRLRRGGKKRRVVLDDDHSEDDEEQKVAGSSSPSGDGRKPEEQAREPDPVPVEAAAEANPGDSETKKKRKILRTRIDERGREVTEVVWDSEDGSKDEVGSSKGQASPAEVAPEAEAPAKAEAPTKPPAPEAPTKAPARTPAPAPKQASKPPTSKPASKPGSKPGKGGKPGPQQGSITSFFKKK